jgi:hypothetical protein
LTLTIWLTTLAVDRDDPPPDGVIDTRICDEEVFSVLDPQRLIVDQDRDRLPPQDPIPREPEVVQANLTGLAHPARQLAEAEDALEAGGLDRSAVRLAQDHRWRHIEDTPLRVGAFMGPVAPKLIVGHDLRILAIDRRTIGAASDIGIQHAALNGKTPFSQVLPGMPPHNGGPADADMISEGSCHAG